MSQREDLIKKYKTSYSSVAFDIVRDYKTLDNSINSNYYRTILNGFDDIEKNENRLKNEKSFRGVVKRLLIKICKLYSLFNHYKDFSSTKNEDIRFNKGVNNSIMLMHEDIFLSIGVINDFLNRAEYEENINIEIENKKRYKTIVKRSVYILKQYCGIDILKGPLNDSFTEMINLCKFEHLIPLAKFENIDVLQSKTKFSEPLNTFIKGMPLDIVKKHFKPLKEKKNNKNAPYLTDEQFRDFINLGFTAKNEIDKVKLNYSYGEKGKIIKLFYTFYIYCVSEFDIKDSKQMFIDLILNCFSNNWTYSEIKSYFKPNKTKENL